MTQEEKTLLLKDLCGRLPYNTVIEVIDNRGKEEIRYTTIISCAEIDMFQHDEKMIKPYLRRLSSMTDKEQEEFRLLGGVISYNPNHNTYSISAFSPEAYDWLNKKMFDYRGLIEKGLAIEAPEGMYNS